MFARIALLLGVLSVPVLLVIASQGLGASAAPPDLPGSSSTVVASVPAATPSAPTASSAPSASAPGSTPAPATSPASAEGETGPRAIPIQPRPVGTPADLDGDSDDDGVPDRDDADDERDDEEGED